MAKYARISASLDWYVFAHAFAGTLSKKKEPKIAVLTPFVGSEKVNRKYSMIRNLVAAGSNHKQKLFCGREAPVWLDKIQG